MSKKASPIIVGSFVLGALALIVIGVFMFGSQNLFTTKYQLVMYFSGSVKGLQVGAPISFRGVKIGSITGIDVEYDTSNGTWRIPVYGEIERNRIEQVGPLSPEFERYANDPRKIIELVVAQGLRAQLQLQSVVTGQLFVLLDVYPDTSYKLVGANTNFAEIPTIPSPMEKLSRTLQEIPIEELITKVSTTLEGIDTFVNSAGVQQVPQQLNETLTNLKTLMSHLDSQLGPLIESLQSTSKTTSTTMKDVQVLLRGKDGKIIPLAAKLAKVAEEAQVVLKQADLMFANGEKLVAPDSALNVKIANTLQQFSSAARSLQLLTDYLERHPEALLRGKQLP